MLSISSLQTSFASRDGAVKAVDSVDLTLKSGEKIGLIGETGCGKTVLGMSVVRLLPPSATTTGTITYQGRSLFGYSEKEMQKVRGSEISFILQNPTTSLNPLIRVGDQVAERLREYQGYSGSRAYREAIRLMRSVNFPDAEKRGTQYPHELSGGMRQKVMIAMGIAGDPSLIIADEPTKALDKRNKAEILGILNTIAGDRSMIMITHDLTAAGEVCDRIAVMYAGELVEEGPAEEVLTSPSHPYTRAFIAAHPKKGCRPIPGSSPSLISPPSGCRFHPRCPDASPECSHKHPFMNPAGDERSIRCHCH